MAESNADGLELVVRLHKTHRNGEYNPPATIYYYRSYIHVLIHMKNVVHKLNFGPVVLPFFAKIFCRGKSPQPSFDHIHFQQQKETQHSWNYYQNSFVSTWQEARLHCSNGIFLALNLRGCLYFSLFFRNLRMLSAFCYSSSLTAHLYT